MILIIAPPDDTHADVIAARLKDMGHSSYIWDATLFPLRDRLWWTPEDEWGCQGAHEFHWSEVTRVWWRRFRAPTISPRLTDPNVRTFSMQESRDALRGVLAATDIRVTNDVDAERRAGSKMLQLVTAKKVGLVIPETIVSNDRRACLEFLVRHPRAIIKPLQANYVRLVETRQCDESYFEDEFKTSICPATVQELIVCVADVRVTVIGEQVFAAALFRKDANDRVDWRTQPGKWTAHELPLQIKERLIQFMKCMQLDSGSLDFRLTPEGDYVFLEVNPSGQFLFLEVDAGLPVSEAFAAFLAG